MLVLNGTERTQRDNAFFTRSVTPQLDNSLIQLHQEEKEKSQRDKRYIFKVFGIRGAQHLR